MDKEPIDLAGIGYGMLWVVVFWLTIFDLALWKS